MSDLPAPLVPADCDLRGQKWMPLDRSLISGRRYRANFTDQENWYRMLLIEACMGEIPAASLPDDPNEWAQIVGKNSAKTRQLCSKIMSTSGDFVKCIDNRWYHVELAKEALKTWNSTKNSRRRAAQSYEAKKDSARRLRGYNTIQDNIDNKQQLYIPTTAGARDEPTQPPATIKPDGTVAAAAGRRFATPPPDKPTQTVQAPDDVKNHPGVDTALRAFHAARQANWPNDDDPLRVETWNASRNTIAGWINAGASGERIAAVITAKAKARADSGGSIINSIRYFDGAVRDAIGGRGQAVQAEPQPAAQLATGKSSDDLARETLARFYRDDTWWPSLGPKPGKPGCKYSPDEIQRLGFDHDELIRQRLGRQEAQRRAENERIRQQRDAAMATGVHVAAV